MKITFLGAAHEVTGSCTLLECGQVHALVDCGMEQGRDIFVNQSLPVPAGEVDFVLLTHAHVDHSGDLPLLVKEGFRGPIYATEETCNLCRIMLLDCAHIQESEAEWQNRKKKRSGETAYEPIYTTADAEAAIELLRPVRYGEQIQVSENISVRYSDVCHLLGSACIEVWMTEDGENRKMVFSGDIGNYSQPILKDVPETVSDADYVMIESTYGDRLHDRSAPPVALLADCIQRTLDRGGNLVIPSFAVGRTQEMLYFIREIKEKGMVHGHDNFPVFMDSPMANEATAIYLQCDRECLDDETRALVDAGINPIWSEGLQVAVSTEESRAINDDATPKVIISSSGMCEAGRIRHHLKHNLWRPECTVLFVGYQAEGTLGRKLYDGEKRVKLFGEEIQVQCEIAFLPGKSGHADRDGLLAWLSGFEHVPKMVFVNHGEDTVTDTFASTVQEKLGFKAFAPYSGTVFDLKECRFLACPEGIPVPKKEPTGGEVGDDLYHQVLRKSDELDRLLRALRDKPNKLLRNVNKELDALIKKYS